jgi:transcriptional regulator of acetoin/glycerol metabolism
MAAVLSEGRQHIAPEALCLSPYADRQPQASEGAPATASDPIGTRGGAPHTVRPTSDALALLLERHKGNVADVARELRRQRTLVWRWVRKAGLDPARYRIKDEVVDGDELDAT